MTYTHYIEVWRDRFGDVWTDPPDDIIRKESSLKWTEQLRGKTICVWKIKWKNEANRKTT